MKERIAYLCGLLPRTRVFADVGCDHGYMTRYMLEKELCERAYVSDISAGSLSKAEKLLSRHIAAGRCVPVVCDGLRGIPEPCDFVLIAGMGGEEIVKILGRDGIPQRFLLQPMKNTEKVRRFLAAHGAAVERDETFSEGREKRKYYDLLLGSASGGSQYTEREFCYGRDNLNGGSLPFLFQMREELEKTNARLAAAGEKSRGELLRRREELEEVIHEVESRL